MPPPGHRPQHHLVVGLLAAIAMAASVAPGSAFGVLAPFLLDSLEISRARLGLLITACMAVGATLATYAGVLVDRHGPGRVIRWLCLAVLAGIVVMVISGSYWGLLVGALIAALANAAANPATNSMVATSLPAGRRGVAIGIKQSGIQFTHFAFGGLPLIASAAGWRTAIAVTAILPLAGLIAFSVRSVPPVPATLDSVTVPGASGRFPPGVWWLTIYAFSLGLATGALLSYLVLYAVERLDMSRTLAGLAATVTGGLGVVSRVVVGRIAERLRHASGLLAILAGMAVVVAGLLLAAPGMGTGAFWIATAIGGMSVAAWNAVAMLAVISEVDVGLAGRASGIVLTGFLGGLTISPVLFGWSVDQTGDYVVGWVAVAVAAAFSLAVALAWRRTAVLGSVG